MHPHANVIGVHLLFERAGKVLLGLGTPSIREPDRCAALDWWPYGALPAPLVDYTAVALTGIAAGRTYTEMGWAA